MLIRDIDRAEEVGFDKKAFDHRRIDDGKGNVLCDIYYFSKNHKYYSKGKRVNSCKVRNFGGDLDLLQRLYHYEKAFRIYHDDTKDNKTEPLPKSLKMYLFNHPNFKVTDYKLLDDYYKEHQQKMAEAREAAEKKQAKILARNRRAGTQKELFVRHKTGADFHLNRKIK